MGRISFDSTLPLIVFPVTVSDINADVFRDVVMALDTGATTTIIPIDVNISFSTGTIKLHPY